MPLPRDWERASLASDKVEEMKESSLTWPDTFSTRSCTNSASPEPGVTKRSRFCEAEIGKETCPRYDSLRLETIKSDIAAAVSVWLANMHKLMRWPNQITWGPMKQTHRALVGTTSSTLTTWCTNLTPRAPWSSPLNAQVRKTLQNPYACER